MYNFIKYQLERLRIKLLAKSADEIDEALVGLTKARDRLVEIVDARTASVEELDAQVEAIRDAQVQFNNEKIRAERVLRNLSKLVA